MIFRNFSKQFLVVVLGPLVMVSLFVFLMYEVGPRTLEAGTGDNVYGNAWSSNIGWINFNDCDDPTPPGTGCGPTSFGVSIDGATGDMSGYAWSSNVGWLRFDAPDPDPGGPSSRPPASVVGTELQGWARFCEAAPTPSSCDGGIGPGPTSGGWDGWVSLNCLNTSGCGVSDYQVRLPICTGLEGYAWGGDVAGWIKFRSETAEEPPVYGVDVINLALPPPPPTNLASSLNYCENSPDIRPTFSWDYVDSCATGHSQTAFQIQIAQDDNGVPDPTDFSSLVYDTCDLVPGGSFSNPIDTCVPFAVGTCPSGTTCSYTPVFGIPELIYNQLVPNEYIFRIKSYNENGWSGWSELATFEIVDPVTGFPVLHAKPAVEFNFIPSKPFIDEPVTFDSTPFTSCFDTGGVGDGKNPVVCPLGVVAIDPVPPFNEGFTWNFGDGQPGSILQNPLPDREKPIYAYVDRSPRPPGYYSAVLVVRDDEGYQCSDLENIEIGVRFRIPDWREIAP